MRPCRSHPFVVLLLAFFGLQLFQIVVEPIEALVEEAAVVFEPIVDVLERPRLDAARPPLRLAAARDQAGALQHLEMLGDRRQAHGEGLGQFRHRGLAQRQPRQDGAAGGIGEGGEGGVEGQFEPSG